MGFVVIEPEYLKFKYETKKTKHKKTCHRKRQNTNRRRKRQLGGFLNRYDFAYAADAQSIKLQKLLLE